MGHQKCGHSGAHGEKRNGKNARKVRGGSAFARLAALVIWHVPPSVVSVSVVDGLSPPTPHLTWST